MGKVLSGICCVIVGLEVLIGVPVAVCLSFIVLTQGGPVVQEFHAGPIPSTIPPPPFAGPVSYPPAIVPPLPPAPPSYSRVEASPEGLEMPAVKEAPVAKEISAHDNPVMTAITEARERIGNPLAGTVLAPAADEPSQAEFVQSLRQLDESAASLPTLADAIQPPAIAEQPADDAVAALKQSVERLYQLAGRFEDEGKFGQADRLRSLARSVREELATMGKGSAPAEEPPIALAPYRP